MFGWKALGAVLKQTGRLNPRSGRNRGIDPTDAESHGNLGGIFQLNKLDEAQASYRAAILLEPDYASAHSNREIHLRSSEN